MSFVVVPASYVYLLRDGAGDGGTEVLLQLRQGTTYMDGHWAAAAAGHVERGETAYAAAQREATEELGITEVDLSFEFTMQRTRGGEPIDERVDFFFTARAWRGDPRIVEPDKAGELRWCRLSELPSPMVPHEAFALGQLGTQHRYLSHGFDDDPGGQR